MAFFEQTRADLRSAANQSSAYQWAARSYQAAAGSARFNAYASAGTRGFMSALGFQFVPAQGGLQATWGESVTAGATSPSMKFAKGAGEFRLGAEGRWRFLGLRQGGMMGAGRIGIYQGLRAQGAGVGAALNQATKDLFLGPGLMLAFTGMAAYEGFQREGLWGAAKSAGHMAVEWAAFDIALHALGAAALPLELAALGAAAGYGMYKLADYGAKRHRQQRMLEFGGSPVEDQFGTIATMRQRSLQEMQRSHGAIRGALGTEAQFMHVA